MVVKKENLSIELDEELDRVKLKINELKKLKEILENFPEHNILSGKTQMIGKGNIENVRSRREHSQNIQEISRKIIEGIYEQVVPNNLQGTDLYLLNKELQLLYSDIVSIGHDIGHTPFGHAGERILNSFVKNYKFTEEEITQLMQKRRKIYGEQYERNQGHSDKYRGTVSFEHNEKSAELMYYLMTNNGINPDLVDVERIISGILAHSTSRVHESLIPKYLESQIVRQVDKIEYMNYDYEEIKNLIKTDNMSEDVKEFAKKDVDDRIQDLTNRMIDGAIKNGKITDSMKDLKIIKKFIKSYNKAITVLDEDGKGGIILDENIERIKLMMGKVIAYYLNHPEEIQEEVMRIAHPIVEDEKEDIKKIIFKRDEFNEDNSTMEKVITYICRMDDAQLKQKYVALARQRIIKGRGYGIEPITQEEIERLKEEQLQQQAKKIKYAELQEGEKEHSEDEYMQMAIEENRQYLENELTQEGKNKKMQNRRKHREEYQIDQKLNDMKIDFDELRIERQLTIQEKAKAREEIKELVSSEKENEEYTL